MPCSIIKWNHGKTKLLQTADAGRLYHWSGSLSNCRSLLNADDFFVKAFLFSSWTLIPSGAYVAFILRHLYSASVCALFTVQPNWLCMHVYSYKYSSCKTGLAVLTEWFFSFRVSPLPPYRWGFSTNLWSGTGLGTCNAQMPKLVLKLLNQSPQLCHQLLPALPGAKSTRSLLCQNLVSTVLYTKWMWNFLLVPFLS